MLAVSSVAQKSIYFDEMGHIVAGAAQWEHGDHRLMAEGGALPQRLGALPAVLSGSQFPDLSQSSWQASDHWYVGTDYLFLSGNNLESMLWRGRALMAVLGVLLGLVIYLVSRSLFGSTAALLSLTLFAFSPTMIAQARLLTSDFATAAFFFIAAIGIWRSLERVTLSRVAVSTLAVGLLLVSKPIGLLIAPMAVLLFALRLSKGDPLTWGSRPISGAIPKTAVVAALGVAHIVVAALVVWGFHDFRYAAFADSTAGDQLYRSWTELLAEPGMITSILSSVREHQLLPEAYLYGLAFTFNNVEPQSSFLHGSHSLKGWLGYYPYSFLLKTLVPTILLGILTILSLVQRRTEGETLAIKDGLYRTAPLWVLWVVYWLFSMGMDVSAGHGHLAPIYAPLFVVLGASVYWIEHTSTLLRRTFLFAWLAVPILGLFAWPHYFAYFNEFVGGSKNGYRHLVDGSLDRGQDLPLLKRWLDDYVAPREDKIPVYMSYYGSDHPSHYGIDVIQLPGFFEDVSANHAYDLRPGIYCISATILQSVHQQHVGPWAAPYENDYLEKMDEINRYKATKKDPEARRKLVADHGMDYWNTLFLDYARLRLARLCAFLRQRKPDATIGHSILIHELDDFDIIDALYQPPIELEDDVPSEFREGT